jgi:large subunit ribosomal protein L29|tara:strand:- start:356 stop:553 length:198 start_codon:yes stop_codon:yes gene_type:complete
MNAKTKKLDIKTLRAEVSSNKKNLMNLRFQKSTGQLEKTSEIRKTRKKIASLKTLISQEKGNINA